MRLTAFLGLLFLPQVLLAQLTVKLEFDRDQFMPYESAIATVYLVNNSASTLRLGENDPDWLNFQITSPDGAVVSRSGIFEPAKPVELAPGEAGRTRYNLTPNYRMWRAGQYRVTAVVHAPGLTIRSRTKTIEVEEGIPLWNREVGLIGKDGQEFVQKYTLSQFTSKTVPHLYITMSIPEKRLTLLVQRLQPIIDPNSVTCEFDNLSNIHIFYRTESRGYAYYVINTVGDTIDKATYYDFNSRPQLSIDAKRAVGVLGGVRYNPEEKKKEAEARGEKVQRLPRIDPNTPIEQTIRKNPKSE